MAKLMYVPDWLYETIQESGLSLDDLKNSKLSSTILSKADIINYHLAHYEFLKLLLSVEHYPTEDEYIMILNNLFWHPQPDLPELDVYHLNAKKYDGVNWSALVSDAHMAEQVAFKFEQDCDNQVTYIIGTFVKNDSVGAGMCHADAASIIWNVLNASHNGLRVQHEFSDKSSVLRESPILSQLYVLSLCNSGSR